MQRNFLTMTMDDYSETLASLAALQEQPLSIIRLSEPISAPQSSARTSDASSSALDNPTSASLEADLNHYKVYSFFFRACLRQRLRMQELFSKLRFSYLEQVTKEKFLRAIVGEPPLIVDHQENIELEAELAEVKAILKAQKEDVANMVKELDERGRELSRRYETVQLQTTHLSSLPPQIASLNSTLASLQREAELADLDQQLKSLQQALPSKQRELEKAENELRAVEAQKEIAVQGAREAMGRRGDGAGGEGVDELELRGRWLRGVETSLRAMLEV
ncbi:hypothetical protein G7Y79_00004g013560 [Physcia stellaris]|nr:hypothetical protein G7Y79_00004g013560 [Physcia stellaris]